MILADSSIDYYHNDHLGTPQKMTDATGAVVWSADYLPFGKADVTVQTVKNNLRFKGQYFDEDTGLHYNSHRYYDPGIGRYLRPDPICLAGGINLYTYVLNDPVNLIDPYGLLVDGGVISIPTSLIVATAGVIVYTVAPQSIKDQMANDVVRLWDLFWAESDAEGEGDCDVPTSPPDGLVENPDRPGSWGEYDKNGTYHEKWRLDKGRPELKRGHGQEDHIHLDGKKTPWYPVR